MCGLAGFVHFGRLGNGADGVALRAMLDAIRHRGPDDEGQWTADGVAIGHRRLSIVDLSPLGHQPMISRSGRHVLAYNGEIYNHAALRRELQGRGHEFLGHSDTEVLLALIESIGLQPALARCIGMFALALWDRETRTLQLARDRLGEKPLYWGWSGGQLLFGSELKALRQHPAFDSGLDPSAIASLLRYGYVPSPASIHSAVRKVEPGSIVTLPCGPDANGRPGGLHRASSVRWWWPPEASSSLAAGQAPRRFDEASQELEALLLDAVGQQMHADVPLGAFLSGGVDSTLVVALMQRQASRPVRTFAIGFDEPGLDEAPHAEAVARHLGSEHTAFYVNSGDALAVIPQLPAMYDEPLGDASQIPTFLVARMAREHVTVALSGDGGDELFGGYRKYPLGLRWSERLRHAWAGRCLGALPWRQLEAAERALRPHGRLQTPRLRTGLHLLASDSDAALAMRLSEANREAPALLAQPGVALLPQEGQRPHTRQSYLRTAMRLDSLHYLPDDVLVKVDRATMAVSLESRAPLLDHRVAEFAAGLPDDWLFDGQGGKRILRDVLYRHVPRELIDRPKQGFSVPLARWLRTDLKEWAGDLLQDTPRTAGLLNLSAGRALFADHLAGRRDASAQLWPLLSLTAWLNATDTGRATA
jgi:asparagine synthase (glutamine-hydrolysing)